MDDLATIGSAEIARRHVRRAAGQLREAIRALSSTVTEPQIAGVLHLHRESDLRQLEQAVQAALDEHRRIDVVLFHRDTPHPTPRRISEGDPA